jgi:hypothetical protein
MRQVLAEWRETGDEVEQTETWEELKLSRSVWSGIK